MKNRHYSNEFETYEIIKIVTDKKTVYRISQDGIFSDREYERLKDAKQDIDNQNVRF